MTGGIGKLIDRWRKPVPPVLVYQMGKVGSSTVHRSLAAAGVAVEQVQFLTDTWIDQVTRQYRSAGAPIPENVRRSENMAARIRTAPDQCQKVITLVRDPVARNISSLFETVDPLHPDLILANGAVDVPAAIEELLRQFAAFDESTDYVCNWFDEELRTFFGLDVFEYPFPHDAGYLRIRQPRIDLLILRLEDLNECFEPAMQEFLECDTDFLVQPANLGADKPHAGEYRSVLDRIEIPVADCTRIYESRICRHFYSGIQLAEFLCCWSGSPLDR